MADKKIKKISTKRKFVADGVFEAELNELLMKCLSQEGYGGVEVRAANMQTEIRVFAAESKQLLDRSIKKVKELQSLIEKRYGFNDQDNPSNSPSSPSLSRTPSPLLTTLRPS